MSVRRGHVCWADLEPVVGHEQAGHRLVLIVSADAFNARSGMVIAMPLTSQPQRASWPLVVEAGTVHGRTAWVKVSQVRAISTSRLGKVVERGLVDLVESCLDAQLSICGRKLSPERRASNETDK